MSAKKTLSQVKAECDIAHGNFIKDRDCPDGFCYCISCKKPIGRSECEAGHYVPRQHMATRWDERNVNAQCHHCNYDLRGNISGYTMGLMDKYGHEIIDELIILSKQTAHFSAREIEEKTKYFKQKRGEL